MTSMHSEPLTTKARIARWLQAISLFVLVSVVALRPLVSETYDSAGNSISRAIDVLADPSPARTLGFDLAILVATCLWLLAFALEHAARYQWTGLELGFVLLAAAGGLSCCFAGNKRLAINGTVDWFCLPILAITFVQLLRTQWQRRLVLAAILASASVNAAQCFEQSFVGFAETIEQYESGKEEFWARQGVELDSTTVDAFERRLRAREASGFFAHSNVAGAYLMFCAFAAIGVIALQLRTLRELSARPVAALSLIVALILTLVLIGAVFLTGSTGAIEVGAIGLGLLIVAWWKREWIAIHRRTMFWISWIIIISGIAAVIGHGLYHDSLPGWSLTFRWQYWKASSAMIADHFWTGIGRENFGRQYTFYKDIASPEEVSNPHNFFIQAASEWGIVGLIAVLAMLLGVTLLASKTSSDEPTEKVTDEPDIWSSAAWIVGIGFVVVAGRAALLGSSETAFVYYSAATTALIWLPAMMAFFLAANPGVLKSLNRNRLILRKALAVGLFAFLLQDTISFALFIPASATTFFALLAVWLPGTQNSSKGLHSRPRARLFAVVLAACMTAAFANYLLAPVVKSQYHMALAESLLPEQNAILEYTKAQLADPLDPTSCVEEARRHAASDDSMVVALALQPLTKAQARDPYKASLFWMESQVHLRLAALSGRSENYFAAVQAAKRALAIYPQDPAGLVSLADTEMAAGKASNLKELLLAAKSHYDEALSLDEKRLEWETIQRFRPRVVDEIHAKIRSVEKMLHEQM